jgi:hypothetical protein
MKDLTLFKKEIAAKTTSAQRLLELVALDASLAKIIAKAKHTPAHVLENLARSSDTSVQLAVANNPNAPVSALEYLGGHGKYTILKAVAKHSNTPNEVLEKLARHKQESVREALLERIHLPVAAIEALRETLRPERRWWLPWKFSSVIMSKSALLEQFMTDPAEVVRRSVAQHIPLTDEQFEGVFNDVHPNVRANLYSNPSSTPERLERLFSHPDDMTRAALARQSLSVQEQLRFVKDASPYVRAAIVQQMQLPEDALRQLAIDESLLVRGAVAGRFFSTPVDLLEQLSRDPEPFVRAGVAQNSDSTVEILEHLSRDADERVRFCVACNYKTPENILEHLARDTSVTRFRLQGNNITKASDQELTIAERASQHLQQKRYPKSAESYSHPVLEELFVDITPNSNKSFEESR